MEQNQETVVIQISGMSCSHCQKKVSDAIDKLPGIIHSDVSLSKAEANVAFDPDCIDREAIVDAVSNTSFSVVSYQ